MNRKNRGYWTIERCKKEALKYISRSEFKKKSGGAYNAAKKNGWLDKLCINMVCLGNRIRRLVYVYEFEDKSIYVGLTYNIDERDKKHRRDKRSGVFKHILKTGSNPKLTYTNFMHVEDAKTTEGEFVRKFRENGYKILNFSKTGGVGGGYLKWTFEKCKVEALSCTARKEFYDKNESAYNSARRNGWLEDICSHMNKKATKNKGYWTKEKCKEEALKYNRKIDLYKNSPGAYMAMLNNNWLTELCPNMKSKKRNGYWTKNLCLTEALKYKSKSNFRKLSGGAYRTALKNGWLDEIKLIINKK